jgi:hypothetical protein
MIRFKVNFSDAFQKAKLRARKELMAAALLRQVQNRIKNGGDEEYLFPALDFPRPDGSTNNPLYHTGKHLLESLKTFVTTEAFGLKSRFKGAEVLNKGTVGKGGTLPTIRPTDASALFIPLTSKGEKLGSKGWQRLKKGKDFIWVKSVDLKPRNYLRISAANRKEFADILAGK